MGRRAAFTLIGLLMVVLVVGILAAVAIPTYQGQKASSRDAHVVERLENALRAARAEYTLHDGTYPDAATLSAAMSSNDPASAPAAAGGGFTQGQVQVARVSGQRVELRSQGEDGTNFMIVDDRTPDGRQTSRLRGYRGDPTGLALIANAMWNPGFESGVRGAWTDNRNNNANAATDMTADACWRGSWCGQRVYDVDVPGVSTLANGRGAPVYGNPGDKVAVRAAVRITTGSAQALRVYVEDFEPPNQIPGSGQIASVANPEIGKWYELGRVITMTGTRASLTIRPMGVTAGTTIEYDDGMLVHAPPGDRLPAYFDGAHGGGRWDAGGAATGVTNGYLAERAGPSW